jgi:flagellar motor switch protein FliN/FliY
MTQAPHFWLKNIQSALTAAKEVPLWGHLPTFPLEQCAEILSSALSLPNLKLSLEKTDVVPFEQLLLGLSTHPLIIPLTLSPLKEPLFFVMSKEDVSKLSVQALTTTQPARFFADTHLQEGFFHYLLLEALQATDTLRPFGDLSLKMAPPSSLPKEDSLSVDIAISSGKLRLWGRILCPIRSLESIRSHFSTTSLSIAQTPLVQDLDLTVHLEVGSTTLSAKQWKKVECGDFIVLDRCSYDPTTQKGAVTITFENTPLFRARLKQQSIKLLDYAYYHEEEKTMDTHMSDEESKDSDETAFSEESSSFAEEGLEEEIEGDSHLWSAEKGQEGRVENLIAAEKIPLTIVVEVARVRMGLQKILELKPGNVLELPVHPELGVDLTINGKKMARGELVKLGEAIGVKILQIG